MNTINVLETLEKHNKKYPMYYQTDHHWTTHGAYFAYKEYVGTKGLKAIDLKLKKVTDEVHEDKNIPLADVLKALEATIQQRKHDMPENSYTTHLFQKGEEKILKKLGEETIEVILARNNEGETVYEVADVLYHLMVYLVSKDISFDKVLEELRSRM
jgi:phosphoribosyl-ATP pyrophosphohydrolase